MFCPTPPSFVGGLANLFPQNNKFLPAFSQDNHQQGVDSFANPNALGYPPLVQNVYKQFLEHTLLTARLAQVAQLQLGASGSRPDEELSRHDHPTGSPMEDNDGATDLSVQSVTETPTHPKPMEGSQISADQILRAVSSPTEERVDCISPPLLVEDDDDYERTHNQKSILKEEDLLDKFRGKDITVSRIKKSRPDEDSNHSNSSSDSTFQKYVQSILKPDGENDLGLLNAPPITDRLPCLPPASLSGPSGVCPPPMLPSPMEYPESLSPLLSPHRLPADLSLPPAPALLVKALTVSQNRKPRSQKKPIPEEQKNERYYERRTRNNMAAKKSRDQRKLRENLVTRRALLLESENKKLRAEVAAYRQRALAMQNMLEQMGVSTTPGEGETAP